MNGIAKRAGAKKMQQMLDLLHNMFGNNQPDQNPFTIPNLSPTAYGFSISAMSLR